MEKYINMGVGVVVLVIAAIIAITAIANQAPTVAGLTNTATGTALANAGITSTTLAGVVYSFINVFWALGALLVVLGLLLAHKYGAI